VAAQKTYWRTWAGAGEVEGVALVAAAVAASPPLSPPAAAYPAAPPSRAARRSFRGRAATPPGPRPARCSASAVRAASSAARRPESTRSVSPA